MAFDDAQSIFEDPLSLSMIDPDHSDQEERWLTIGMDRYGRLLTVAHTYRDEAGAEVIRIINARQAEPRERRAYEQNT